MSKSLLDLISSAFPEKKPEAVISKVYADLRLAIDDELWALFKFPSELRLDQNTVNTSMYTVYLDGKAKLDLKEIEFQLFAWVDVRKKPCERFGISTLEYPGNGEIFLDPEKPNSHYQAINRITLLKYFKSANKWLNDLSAG